MRRRSPLFWLAALREVAGSLVLMVVRHLPGRAGWWLRRRYYGRRLGPLGEETQIDEGVHIVGAEHVFIGSRCWIAANAFIGAGPPNTEGRRVLRRQNPDFTGREGEVRIGDHVYLAPQTLINGHGGVEIGDNVAVS